MAETLSEFVVSIGGRARGFLYVWARANCAPLFLPAGRVFFQIVGDILGALVVQI